MTQKKNIFLATTALTEFWDTSSQILFLGEWCLRHDRRKDWENLHYKVMDCPWDNSQNLKEAFDYSNAFYKKVLNQLAGKLNKIHNVQFSNRYWAIVLGDWLWRYVHAMYDRFQCLKMAIEEVKEMDTILLDGQNCFYPKDSLEFFDLCASDLFNLEVYSEFLRAMGLSFPSRKLSDENVKTFGVGEIPGRVKFHIKNVLTGAKSRSFLFSSKAEVVLGELVMPPSIIKHLKAKSPLRYHELCFERSWDGLQPSYEMRQSLTWDKTADVFESACCQMISRYLPMVFLEGYTGLRKKMLKYVRNVPRVVVTAAGWRFNPMFGLYVAEVAERGAKLIGIQHGGGYGLFELDNMLDQELEMVDRFVSWGWTEDNEKIVPLAQPMLSLEKSKSVDKKEGMIIFAGTISSRYPNIFQSSPSGHQYKAYIQKQINFFLSLSEETKKMFLVRLYQTEQGWYNKERLEEAVPNLQYDDYSMSFIERIKSNRMVVADNNQTTYLQSIGLNIPTVIFWDEDIWRIRESAWDIFKELKRVNIFHETPEVAAQFVNDHYQSIEEWWFSKDVQSVAEAFREKYCRVSQHWEDEWQEMISQELTCVN